MKSIVIDTNAYSNFMRGNQTVYNFFSRANEILIPVPVLAELRIGFNAGTKEEQNLDELMRFMASPRVRVAIIGEHTALLFAEIFSSLKRKGKPIPINDVWIASCAMEHSAILISEDEHFNYIDGLLLNQR